MKISLNKSIQLLLSSLFLLAGLNSCVKNRNSLQIDYSQIQPIIELITNPNTTGGIVGGVNNLVFSPTPVAQEVRIYVNYAAPDFAPKDIIVTLAKDPAGLTAYNTANGSTLQFLPDSAYTVSALQTTIKQGQRLAYISVFITPSKVDLRNTYGLAFKITDAQGYKLSTNGMAVVFPLLVKNKYDGDYYLRINTVGWAAFGIADGVTYDWGNPGQGNSIGMITAGSNTVQFFDYYGFGSSIQVAFTSGGAPTGFGATSPQFAFDLSTDKLISVVNTTPPDSRNRVFKINPAITTSRFDPSTKNIYAAYIMSQTGRPDQFIYDTLRYQSPRK
jgi:hypothetical protein